MKHLSLLLLSLTISACAYQRSVEVANPDGSKSLYQFVHDVDLWGPNADVVRVHDCDANGCYKHNPQVVSGDGIAKQVLMPAAAVGAAVLWPSDTVSATASGGSTTVGNTTTVTNTVNGGGHHK